MNVLIINVLIINVFFINGFFLLYIYMVKNKIKKNHIDKQDYLDDNINNFIKKGFFSDLFSGMSILKYKFVVYWIPLILYIFVIIFYIFITQEYSEWITAFISAIVIYILYFIIDIIYQNIICKKIQFSKLLFNSAINALTPSIFVFSGYILACILRDVKNCDLSYNNNNSIENVSQPSKNNNTTTQLINIHRNNIILASFCYIFSIIYNNPINKKKCINNKLC